MYQDLIKNIKNAKIRTVTSLLIFVIVLVFLFLVLNNAEAQETILYTENFDTLDMNYYLNIGWSVDYVGGYYAGVCDPAVRTCFFIEPYSWANLSAETKKTLTEYTEANYIEFYFKTELIDKTFDLTARAKNDTTGEEQRIIWLQGQEGYKLMYTLDAVIWFEIGDIREINWDWNYLKIEINKDTNKWRVKLNENDFTLWKDNYSDLDFDTLTEIRWHTGGVGGTGFYIENLIVGSTTLCSSQNCGACSTEGECLGVGCQWNWATNSCYSVIAGQCDVGANLQFCDNQADCEYYGGNWFNDFCWWGAPADITNFDYFYQNWQDKFTTPSPFIQKLANFATPFLQNIGSFLYNFADLFDPEIAVEKGAFFGNGIRQAKGYTATVNEFMGGLPIVEGLFTFLIVCLLVSLIRLIFRLVNFIKP